MLKISDYIDAIEDEIKRWGVPTVLFNPSFKEQQDLENIKTPAVFIFCDSIGASIFSDTQQNSKVEVMEVDLKCVISDASSTADKDILNFASFIKRSVFQNQWQLGKKCSKPAKVTALNISGSQRGLNEWCVSFTQAAHVDPIDPELEFDVNEIHLGINPDSDDDYKKIIKHAD